MTTIQCNCGNTIEVDFPDTYDTASHPEVLREILDGDFMSVPCEKCDSVVKPEIATRITDSKHGIDILFRPENEQLPYLAGKLDLPDAERIVFGYHELEEKILIYINGLNDRTVETIKYFYLQKGGTGTDLSIYLDSISRETLGFRIHGLKNDEIGMAEIKRGFYEKIDGGLEEVIEKEELGDILSPPYVSIKKVYLGED